MTEQIFEKKKIFTERPRVTLTSEQFKLPESDVTFKCQVSGDGQIDISWTMVRHSFYNMTVD